MRSYHALGNSTELYGCPGKGTGFGPDTAVADKAPQGTVTLAEQAEVSTRRPSGNTDNWRL